MGLSDLNMNFRKEIEYPGSNESIGEGGMTAKSKKVVLWGSEDILISSVNSILSSKKEWEVISLSNKEDIDVLIQAVETAHASLVIMQKGEEWDSTFLPMQLIKDIPSLRVITVNLESNSMEVFCKQQIWIRDVSDLISVFDNEA